MCSSDLLSTAQLVARFTEICRDQYAAELDFDTRRLNSLFDQMMQVVGELRQRPGDGRNALSVLYSHENIQVRLKAAIHTLAVRGGEARGVLEEIATRTGYPQSGDAKGVLRALEEGRYQPE